MKRILIYIFLMLSLVSLSYSALTDNNVLYYSNDNDNITGSVIDDLSTSNNDGTISGATSGVTGKLLQAVDFAGVSSGDKITLASTLTLANEFTINFWGTIDDLAEQYHGIISNSADSQGFLFSVTSSPDTLFIEGLGTNEFLSLGSDVMSGTYQMITITRDTDDKIRVYLAGSLIATSTNTQGNSFAVEKLGESNGAGHDYNGKIDEFAVWNRVLTSGELSELYNSNIGLNFYTTSAAIIVTNLSNVYATEDFSINISSASGVNMNFSYSLDSGSFISIANNTNLTSLTLTGQSVGNHNLSIKGVSNGATYWNNATFEIQPYQYFRFYNGTDYLQDYSFDSVSSVGDYVTLDARDYNFGTNALTFSKLGFVSSDLDLVFNNTIQYNKTYNVNISQIMLHIFDIVSNNYVTGTTSITLIASTGYNTTTTTGKVNISDISFVSELYQVIAENEDYTTESIYFNYNNQQILTKNIYLINNSNSNIGTITPEVSADTGQLVQGALCKALEWKPSLSSYISVAEGYTNSNGQTTLNILLNVNQYKIQCSKSGQTVTSSPQIFSSTGNTIPLQINTGTGEVIPNEYKTLTYTFTNSTVNATHQLLRFEYEDSDNLVNTACINSYKQVGTKTTFLSQNCSSSSSGTLFDIVNINNSYTLLGIASITTSTDTTNLKTLTFKAYNDISKSLSQYHLDILLPLLFLMIGVVIGLAITPQNIFISVIGGVLMTWFAIAIVPTTISASIGIFITFIGVLMLYGGNK